MSNPKDQVRIQLTPEQKALVKNATGKDAEAVELYDAVLEIDGDGAWDWRGTGRGASAAVAT